MFSSLYNKHLELSSPVGLVWLYSVLAAMESSAGLPDWGPSIATPVHNQLGMVPGWLMFCCLLFLRNKPMGLAYTAGEGVTQVRNTSRWGSLGHPRGCLSLRLMKE